MCLLNRLGTIVTLTALLAFLRPSVDAAPLVLFEDSRFRGVRSEFKIEGSETCVNIRGKLNDMFSSVNLNDGECFLLCEHDFCRGRCVRVTESVSNLQALGLNDAASSIKRCPSALEDVTSTSTTPTSTTTNSAVVISTASTSTSATSVVFTSTTSTSTSTSSEVVTSISTATPVTISSSTMTTSAIESTMTPSTISDNPLVTESILGRTGSS